MIKKFVKRMIASLTLVAFMAMSVPSSYAQSVVLPKPGTMVALSATFTPPLLKGIKVYPDNPFLLDFILDKGNSSDPTDKLKDESSRLIKYFLASVTVPENDLWVNLSPYEKDRIVPDAFGQTEMGRDLLAQDYLLKQITASVIYPEGEVGKKFWAKVYAEAQRRYGTTDIPVDTFNKVWIVPEKAVVYENKDAAYVVESSLKVMLESDYVAMSYQKDIAESSAPAEGVVVSHQEEGARRGGSVTRPPEPDSQELSKQILRDVIIPILEKEVNEGRNFAQLRQVYHSLILAVWFKDRIKESIFGKAYADQDKIAGVDIKDKAAKDRIWAQYVESFKKGAYNFIREEKDAVSGEMIPRKYFSGGVVVSSVKEKLIRKHDETTLPQKDHAQDLIVRVQLSMAELEDRSAYNEFQDWLKIYSVDRLRNTVIILDRVRSFIKGISSQARSIDLEQIKLFNNFVTAGFVPKEEVIAELKDEKTLDVLISGSLSGLIRKFNVDVLESLLATRLVAKEEVVTLAKDRKVAGVLVHALVSDSSDARKASADVLVRFVAAGIIAKEDVIMEVKAQTVLAMLAGRSNENDVTARADIDVLRSLFTFGIFSKEEIVEQNVLDVVVLDILNKDNRRMKPYADVLNELVASGFFSKQEVITAMQDRKVLDGLLRGLASIDFNVSRFCAQVLNALLVAEFITKEDMICRVFHMKVISY